MDSKITVDVSEYLSQEEMKEICKDVFTNAVARYINTENDLKRIIGNIGYETACNILDKQVPNFSDQIIEQTKKACLDISTYTVFRKSNGWGDKDSIGLTLLEQATKDNKDIIIKKVQEVFNTIDNDSLRYEISDIIQKYIVDKVFEKSDEDK